MRSRVLSFLAVLCLVAATIEAAPVRLSTITVSPGAVAGGTNATGTATLTGAAPRGGATVTLSSSNTAVATVPPSVVVPQGATSATFNVSTSPVTAQAGVTVTGNYGATATASFTVLPPTLASLGVSPSAVTAVTGTATGTVTLSGPSPAGGTAVSLTSASPAATVPASVTVAAGSTSASFAVTTSQVSSTTSATIQATLGADSRVVTLTIQPCVAATATAPSSFPASDFVWFDDYPPDGTTTAVVTWDTAQKASGSRSATTGLAAGLHEIHLAGSFVSLRPNAGEDLLTYLLVNPCAPPRQIVIGWRTASGVWKKAYYGQALIGGEAGMISLGPVPAGGSWLRVAVSASQLGLTGERLDGYNVQAYDGQVWVDRVGQTCSQPQAAAPAPGSADTYWIDDSFPAGATAYNATWSTAQRVSGVQSMKTSNALVGNNTSIQISQASATMPVAMGENLVFYVLLNACLPPTEMIAEWKTTLGETKGAWWGTPHNFQAETTHRSMGAMPAAGEWVRVEIPASQLGLEARTVDGFWFTLVDGPAWVDAVGKSGTACIAPTAPAPAITSGDVAWLDESIGPSALTDRAVLDASQHASGTQSVTMPYGGGSQSFSVWWPNYGWTVNIGDKFVVYALLDPCAVPSQIGFTWKDVNNVRKSVYWGTAHNQWGESSTNPWVNMGPLPAAGTWQRLEIPASLLLMEGRGITEFTTWTYDGRVWVDHVGKAPNSCIMPQAPPPSFPAGDTMWIDDGAWGYTSGTIIDNAQKASGEGSWRYSIVASGGREIGFTSIPAAVSAIGTGEKLVVYALINSCAPTDEIMLRFQNDLGQWKGCYWGNPHGNGEGSLYFSMGPLPPAGGWTRLEVPASQLGLEGRSVQTILLYNYDGQVWFDAIGKAAQ